MEYESRNGAQPRREVRNISFFNTIYTSVLGGFV